MLESPLAEETGEGEDQNKKIESREFRGLSLFNDMDVILSLMLKVSNRNFRTLYKKVKPHRLETKSGVMKYREFINPLIIIGKEDCEIRISSVFYKLGENQIIIRADVSSPAIENAIGDDIETEANKLLSAFKNSGFRVSMKEGMSEKF